MLSKPVGEVFAFVIDPNTRTKWHGGVDPLISDGRQDVVAARYTELAS